MISMIFFSFSFAVSAKAEIKKGKTAVSTSFSHFGDFADTAVFNFRAEN